MVSEGRTADRLQMSCEHVLSRDSMQCKTFDRKMTGGYVSQATCNQNIHLKK